MYIIFSIYYIHFFCFDFAIQQNILQFTPSSLVEIVESGDRNIPSQTLYKLSRMRLHICIFDQKYCKIETIIIVQRYNLWGIHPWFMLYSWN